MENDLLRWQAFVREREPVVAHPGVLSQPLTTHLLGEPTGVLHSSPRNPVLSCSSAFIQNLAWKGLLLCPYPVASATAAPPLFSVTASSFGGQPVTSGLGGAKEVFDFQFGQILLVIGEQQLLNSSHVPEAWISITNVALNNATARKWKRKKREEENLHFWLQMIFRKPIWGAKTFENQMKTIFEVDLEMKQKHRKKEISKRRLTL